MPAPLSRKATAGQLVQVFGTEDSPASRAALRFFRERRIAPQFIDLRRKPIAAGELRRFVERLGARTLVDEAGRPWRDAGLAYLRMDDAELSSRLLADQRLLRLPLVRIGSGCAAGRDEAAWKRLLAEASAGERA
ncbi:MAG TPA: ArsC/Spx/MgsR family protein [Candidatus Binatus sp.]|nr:ArsC/Spx/MgsR family protein [Candidatus Binatus sp.]